MEVWHRLITHTELATWPNHLKTKMAFVLNVQITVTNVMHIVTPIMNTIAVQP